MESIRGRLTIWYATALILSIAVFAVVLYFARRSATYQDLDRRIQSEADLTAGILPERYHARGSLLAEETADPPPAVPERGARGPGGRAPPAPSRPRRPVPQL